jgi:hypothetical protein
MNKAALLAIGAIAVVAMGAVERGAAPEAPAVVASAPRAERRAPAPRLEFRTAFTRQPLPSAEDAFAERSWTPPPPPSAKAGPPPKAVAPPLPFAFSGVMDDETGRTLFLVRNGAVVVAHEGEALDPAYRLVEIRADSAIIEYVPLAENQVLAFPR